MQEVAEEQDAAYIPMPKGRGFTPHFDKLRTKKRRKADRLAVFFCAIIKTEEYRGRAVHVAARAQSRPPVPHR